MNLDRLDKWVSIATNIGVLLGILLLIFELNQNTALMRAEIHAMRAIAKTERQMFLANSGEIATIASKAFAAGFPGDENAFDVLSPEERFRYAVFMQGMKESFGNWHYQCEQGLLDEDYCTSAFVAEVRSLLPILHGMRIALTNMRPSFIADIRDIAAQQGLPVPNEDGTWP